MDECFECGISGEKARLFDVISKEGIIKICKKCVSEENLPLIRRATTFQLKESEKQQTYREGIKEFSKTQVMKKDLNKKEDISLRNIIDKNLKMNHIDKIKPKPYLIDNFHWVIMRARRAKHISREQFAREIGESETLIKMVERGILPENDNLIINKIEGYLSVKLKKSEVVPKVEQKEVEQKEFGLDPVSVRNLTISDLREIKKEKERETFSKPVEVLEEDIESNQDETTV